MQTADQSLSVAAQLYTSRGWNVLPCKPKVEATGCALLAVVDGEGPDGLG